LVLDAYFVVPPVCDQEPDIVLTIVSGGVAPYTILYGGGQLSGIDNQFTIPNVSTGNYTFTVIDANDCTESISISIPPPPYIQIDFEVTDVTCLCVKFIWRFVSTYCN